MTKSFVKPYSETIKDYHDPKHVMSLYSSLPDGCKSVAISEISSQINPSLMNCAYMGRISNIFIGLINHFVDAKGFNFEEDDPLEKVMKQFDEEFCSIELMDLLETFSSQDQISKENT